ncbi:hypothetical protein ACLOJK_031896 [Asimina triloba]
MIHVMITDVIEMHDVGGTGFPSTIRKKNEFGQRCASAADELLVHRIGSKGVMTMAADEDDDADGFTESEEEEDNDFFSRVLDNQTVVVKCGESRLSNGRSPMTTVKKQQRLQKEHEIGHVD